jgi:hypothetical protein
VRRNWFDPDPGHFFFRETFLSDWQDEPPIDEPDTKARKELGGETSLSEPNNFSEEIHEFTSLFDPFWVGL